MKKKPLVSRPHHLQGEVGGIATPPVENWVTAVAAYTSSDLIATGMYVCMYQLINSTACICQDHHVSLCVCLVGGTHVSQSMWNRPS